MKKTLFMLGMGLTIASSMVAGTTAIYTHTDTLVSGENGTVGEAKIFYVNASATPSKITPFKLAPGESSEWGFKVVNFQLSSVSEVNTDVIVNVNIKNIYHWKDFEVSLLDGDKEIEKARPDTDGNVSFNHINALRKNHRDIKQYKLKFTWLDGVEGILSDKEDTELVFKNGHVLPSNKRPSVGGITVSVTGTQSKNQNKDK